MAIREYGDGLHMLSCQLFEVKEKVHQQADRELHDDIGQILTPYQSKGVEGELRGEDYHRAGGRSPYCEAGAPGVT